MSVIAEAANALQVDPYMVVSIMDNRKQRTRTLSNNQKPTWNETLTTIVNDPDEQSITFKLMDDDVGSFDSVRLDVVRCRHASSAVACSSQQAHPCIGSSRHE